MQNPLALIKLMKKKLLLSLGLALALVAGVVGMSAFEAHVINVTAIIENGLSVPLKEISYGTVFPQEELDRPFDISLSGSFLKEDRADDVKYMIRQKPKCAVTSNDGKTLVGPTATGHVILVPTTEDPNAYRIDCGPAPRELALDDPDTQDVNEAETWGVLPSLCPYLSKHQLDAEEASVNVPAFHQPWLIEEGKIVWTEAKGDLSKLNLDEKDTWNIDLKVPCFGGQCAQDWADFVHKFNANADPSMYTQPTTNEHKVFGCDLWVEVTGMNTIKS
jgi:hypothetical protein